MKNLNALPPQNTSKKSIFDYTEEELNRIDGQQDRNRGFIDDDRDIELENSYYED